MLTEEIKATNWIKFINHYFGDDIPETYTWKGHIPIATELNKIGFANSKAFNHMFLPRSGGQDLDKAAVSTFENGCIEMMLGSVTYIVKPKSLTFNSFMPTENMPKDAEYEWFYFRLEIEGLKPSGVYDEEEDGDPLADPIDPIKQFFSSNEELVRLPDGELISRSYWDEGYYGHDEDGDEVRLPEGAKLVVRELRDGAFVLFGKFSTYNRTSSTYDGRHNKMDPEEFRRHIRKAIESIYNKS